MIALFNALSSRVRKTSPVGMFLYIFLFTAILIITNPNPSNGKSVLAPEDISVETANNNENEVGREERENLETDEPPQEPEAMDLELTCFVYQLNKWFDREKWEPAHFDKPEGMSLDEYVQSLPIEKRPKMRLLKDGRQEPGVMGEGNCILAFIGSESGRRFELTLASTGLDTLEGKIFRSLNETFYEKKLAFQSVPTTFDQINSIAEQLTQNVVINTFNAGYKGTGFVMDMILRVVDEPTRAWLLSGAEHWPKMLRVIDSFDFEKYGVSAFSARRIPLVGKTPGRSQLSGKIYSELIAEDIRKWDDYQREHKLNKYQEAEE